MIKRTSNRSLPAASSVIVIKRKGTHIQFMKRGNVIFLPALYIRRHDAGLKRVEVKHAL